MIDDHRASPAGKRVHCLVSNPRSRAQMESDTHCKFERSRATSSSYLYSLSSTCLGRPSPSSTRSCSTRRSAGRITRCALSYILSSILMNPVVSGAASLVHPEKCSAGSANQIRSVVSSAARQYHSSPYSSSLEFTSCTIQTLDFFAGAFPRLCYLL
jgi:hypothetical protein